jgi:hypothetical protein
VFDPIEEAVQAGKIAPPRAEHYRRLMKADPEGTTALLATLAPVLPVGEVGVAVLPSDRGRTATASDPGYPREWLADHKPPSGRIIEGND